MKLTEVLCAEVPDILETACKVRDCRDVPMSGDDSVSDGAAKLLATVLYADLTHSSSLASEFQQRTAAKVVRAFASCMSRLIEDHEGSVTGFDGGRVMGVFLGDDRSTNAAICALKMNYAVREILKPAIADYYKSYRAAEAGILHCVGIDTSPVLAINPGVAEKDDLVIVGRAANFAARLSEVRDDPFSTYVSEDVFLTMGDSAKNGAGSGKLMWERVIFSFAGEEMNAYRSSWQWKP
jgi:class 3 adenylate cyclase